MGVADDVEPVPVTPLSGQSILLLMKKEGLNPDIWTYTSLLSLYAQCAGSSAGVGVGVGVGGEVSLALADKVREEMARVGIKPTGPFINNYMALIGRLATLNPKPETLHHTPYTQTNINNYMALIGRLASKADALLPHARYISVTYPDISVAGSRSKPTPACATGSTCSPGRARRVCNPTLSP